MENVYIPKELLTTVELKKVGKGKWVKGKWIEGTEIITQTKAAYMPVSSSTLKKYPEGAITLEDMCLFSKEDLELKDKILIKGVEWSVHQKTAYGYLADMIFYILRRSDKDDRKDNQFY